MDIGMIVIHVAGGKAIVSRCEGALNGMRLLPATNAADLEAQAVLALNDQGVGIDEDGVYLSTDQLQIAAQFAPLSLPADAITYGSARKILYPDASTNTGWQRVRRDVQAGKLRVWRIGVGADVQQYVSRAEVMKLAEQALVAA